MNDNKFGFAAISAVILAVLFPAYWFNQILNVSVSGGEGLYQDVTGLNPADLVFLLIGVLNIFVYLSLKSFLNERHAFNGADAPLLLLAATSAIYVFGSLAMDALMHFYGAELQLPWHKYTFDINTIALLVSSIVFGVLDIILGIVLFTRAREFSNILRAFAIVILIQGFFELTVVFSPITFVIFPVALILLAILFTREPETLELV